MFFLYLPIPIKQAAWERYQKAKICQDDTVDCRQTQTAVVVDSKTELTFENFRGIRATRSSSRLASTKYHFKIVFGERMLEADVLTGRPVEKNLLGLRNISQPDGDEPFFTSTYFPNGKEIKIELWEDQITFIFFNTLDNAHAIPTASHPVIALQNALVDFFGVSFLIICLIIIPIIVQPISKMLRNYARSH
jgi:hypothetical protein